MNLRHLQTFVAVADAGGLRRAAGRVNLSQPAISRQLHALEAELGVRLFDLIRRRVRLTSAGEDLLQQSRRLLIDAEAIGERARALKSGQTGVLRVGAMPQLIESMMVPFLKQYRGRHPGVEIRLTEDGGLRLPMRLERGDVHLATIPEADERFDSRLLFPVYVLAVMAPDHRLRRRAGTRCRGRCRRPALATDSSLCRAGMVLLGLPSGAYQTEHYLRKCRSADAHFAGSSGRRHCGGTAGRIDFARKGPCRPTRLSRGADRQVAYDCLESAEVSGSLCTPFCRRACDIRSNQLSQPRSYATRAAHAATQGIDINVAFGFAV